MIYYAKYKSPLGLITIAGSENALSGLWIEGQKYYAETVKEEMVEKSDLPVLQAAKQWLDDYFAGKKPDINSLPLAPQGSEFRRSVWKILCEIPYGETITYGDISKQIAAKMNRETMSSQAVGGAVGHNPISIIIPCHRVVGSGGNLTGYAGGLNIKIKLLELEGLDMNRFFVPVSKKKSV